jgi:hypothetical protein
MCAVLYRAQGWWSVTGLAIEIAGFSALSLDVAREYAVTLGSLFASTDGLTLRRPSFVPL